LIIEIKKNIYRVFPLLVGEGQGEVSASAKKYYKQYPDKTLPCPPPIRRACFPTREGNFI